MIDITLRDVQMLLDRPKENGAIVSCYANTSPVAGFRSTWPEHLKEEAEQIERRLEPDGRRRFARDLAVIRRHLDTPAGQRARGMALFSDAEHSYLRVFALAVPIENRLVLDEEPYLVPLLEALHRQRRYLVVMTDSHRARLYAFGWGRSHIVEELDEAVPRKQHSAGECWGKQQATIARHREDHILHYRAELVRHIEKAWSDAPYRGVILLGEHEFLAELRAGLPEWLAKQVVHEGPRAWVGRQPSVTATVKTVLEDVMRAHDERLSQDLQRRLTEHYRVTAGPQEVVDALRNGQVGFDGYVVLEPDRGQAAARCTGCGSVFTVMHPSCPYCQASCAKVNLWQEILLFAARHNLAAHTIPANPELTRHGGVAAVLSREDPWLPAPSPVAEAAQPRSA